MSRGEQRERNHQTVRLGRGRHSSPDDGACVMEMASMLAGEPFSDRPRSVSRVIAGFLRCYNDRLGDERRQSLYAYASKVVGTAGDHAAEVLRAKRCVEWQHEEWERRPAILRWLARPRADQGTAFGAASVGAESVRAIRRVNDRSHARALALVDELVAIRSEPASEPVPTAVPEDLAEPRQAVPEGS